MFEVAEILCRFHNVFREYRLVLLEDFFVSVMPECANGVHLEFPRFFRKTLLLQLMIKEFITFALFCRQYNIIYMNTYHEQHLVLKYLTKTRG